MDLHSQVQIKWECWQVQSSVTKGFTWSYGIDYKKIFAPVSKLNKIHDLSSLAVNQDLPLHQLDIKNVFHSSDLEEEVYMEIPLGLETETNINKFYKLKKNHLWYQAISSSLVWSFYQAHKRFRYSWCRSNHPICKTHTWGKNYHYHHLYRWHNPDQRPWARNRQTQEFSWPWFWN